MIAPDPFERFSGQMAYSDSEVRLRGLSIPANAATHFDEVEVIAPERALAAGVLRQATADLRRFRNSQDAVGREMYMDAYSWFTGNDGEWPYSFRNVCQVLRLSVEAVREEVLGDAKSTWYSQLRRVTRNLAQLMKTSPCALCTGRS
jgi:hypothetical protein